MPYWKHLAGLRGRALAAHACAHTHTGAGPTGKGSSVGMGAHSRASAHACPYMCAHTCGLGGLHTCVGAHAWLGHGHGADVCTWVHTRVNRHVQTCTHVCIRSRVLQHTRAWAHTQQPHVCAHTHTPAPRSHSLHTSWPDPAAIPSWCCALAARELCVCCVWHSLCVCKSLCVCVPCVRLAVTAQPSRAHACPGPA